MRKLLPLLLVLACALPAHAVSESDFKNKVTNANLEPFARDLGGILGAASVDPGRRIGFPGFEAGVASGVQFRPDPNDTILRDSGVGAFGIPLIHAAVGLPVGFDVVAHGLRYSGANVFGGGLRWTALKAPVVGAAAPTVGLAVFADRVVHSAFSSTHYGFNASAGWALPIVTPFVNAGWDLTSVKVGAAATAGVVGATAWGRGVRLGGGADLTPFPFVKLRLAYEVLHGISGGTADLLLKF
jgi:opacity protein-like surface antigen